MWGLRKEISDETMFLQKESSIYAIIPKYYGIAYRCYLRQFHICYPIPINLIVRFWHCWFYPKFRGSLKCPKWGKDFEYCNEAIYDELTKPDFDYIQIKQEVEKELLAKTNKNKEK